MKFTHVCLLATGTAFLLGSCQSTKDTIRAKTVTHYPSNIKVTRLASGFSRPAGLAVDSLGNVLVMNLLSGAVSKVDSKGNSRNFAVGYGHSSAVAIGPGCTVYGSYYEEGVIKRASSQGGIMRTSEEGFSNPSGICFNTDGDLFVADAGTNTVYRISPSGIKSIYATGFSCPVGLAFDANGYLYVANRYSHSISRVNKEGTVKTYVRDIANPHSLAFDSNGNLYVSESGDNAGEGNSVAVVTPGRFVYQLSDAFFSPAGLAFDRSGALYVANIDSGFVSKVTFSE